MMSECRKGHCHSTETSTHTGSQGEGRYLPGLPGACQSSGSVQLESVGCGWKNLRAIWLLSSLSVTEVWTAWWLCQQLYQRDPGLCSGPCVPAMGSFWMPAEGLASLGDTRLALGTGVLEPVGLFLGGKTRTQPRGPLHSPW